jgi:hypothetical protein
MLSAHGRQQSSAARDAVQKHIRGQAASRVAIVAPTVVVETEAQALVSRLPAWAKPIFIDNALWDQLDDEARDMLSDQGAEPVRLSPQRRRRRGRTVVP